MRSIDAYRISPPAGHTWKEIATMDSRGDVLARALAIAVLEWLASNGDDDRFNHMKAIANHWKESLIEGE